MIADLDEYLEVGKSKKMGRLAARNDRVGKKVVRRIGRASQALQRKIKEVKWRNSRLCS